MKHDAQDLSAILRGSPWYTSALRGSRVERAIVLWLRLGRRSRLEGFVAQVIARDGTLIGPPIIAGTVWTIEHGVRSAVLDERRLPLEEGWSNVLRLVTSPTAIVGYRLAALRTSLLASLPRPLRSSFMSESLVDLHEAASLLHRSRIADASGRGTLLEARSTSLADLSALAGVPLSEREIVEDDLRAARAVSTIWAKLLLPRFMMISSGSEPTAPSAEPPPERPLHSTLPPEIAAILEAPVSDDPLPIDAPIGSIEVPLSPLPSHYLGLPVDGGWELRRGPDTLGAPLTGRGLSVALLTDLLGEAPSEEAVTRLCELVITQLPLDAPFEIAYADLRALIS